MDYEIFDKETVWNKRGKPPVLRISDNGFIRFSGKAVEILGITKETKISFMIDKRDDDLIYFYVDDVKGLPLAEINKTIKGNGYQVCCRQLAKRLLKFLKGGKYKNVTFDVVNEKCETPNGSMWFVKTSSIHKPIKWKKDGY